MILLLNAANKRLVASETLFLRVSRETNNSASPLRRVYFVKRCQSVLLRHIVVGAGVFHVKHRVFCVFPKTFAWQGACGGRSGSNNWGGRAEQGYSSDGATFHVKHRSVTACFVGSVVYRGFLLCVSPLLVLCHICRQYCFTWNTALRCILNSCFSYLCGKNSAFAAFSRQIMAKLGCLRLNAGYLRLNRVFLPLRSRTKYCFHEWSLGAGKHLKVSVSALFALLPPYRSVKRGARWQYRRRVRFSSAFWKKAIKKPLQ